MTSVLLNDLMAQSSVDPGLEAKLVANADNLDGFLAVANAAGYPLTKEGLLSLAELSDEELAGVTGGNWQQDHKKWIDVLFAAARALRGLP